MEFILGFLSGLGFWSALAIIVEAFLLFAFVEFNRGFAGLVSVVVFLVAFYFVSGFPIWVYVYENPVFVALCLTAYTLVGIFWSMLKWDRYVAAWRRNYDKVLEGFLNDKKVQIGSRLQIPDHLKGEWQKYNWEVREVPRASKNKDRIVTWMMFWPWSLIWTFFADFIKNFFEWIYRNLAKVYDAITVRHTKGVQ